MQRWFYPTIEGGMFEISRGVPEKYFNCIFGRFADPYQKIFAWNFFDAFLPQKTLFRRQGGVLAAINRQGPPDRLFKQQQSITEI